MVDTIILIPAVVLGLGATITIYWHAQHQNSDRPGKWSGIVGLTFLLSPLIVDEVVFYFWGMVTDFFYPLYYHGLVFGLALGISALVVRHYHRSVTTA
ncbi:hypothetical protein BRC82_09680 [Halobacteriales archaeon QS_1_67_19]|nr:MAG: hypothetical protein BRC82_09680 [Halobacteriales archaeon QS_1_67_19]